MELTLMFLGGVFVGTIITLILRDCFKASGTLKIDNSNPEKDVYRIVIDNFDAFTKKKRILLKVDHNADLSQQ